MSTKPRVSCRLSPNEEAVLLHQQREERRRARLVQVREQERVFAQRVRDEVRSKREAERRLLEEHLQTAVEASHNAELRELEERYLSRMRQMGQGHSNAQYIHKEENRLQELRLLLTAEQRWRAQDRHLAAMKELTANQLRKKEGQQSVLQSRRCALEEEKRRAQEVATKPQAAPTLIMDLAVGKGHRVRLKEVEGYASTYYHIPNNTVQRARTPELSGPSAHHMAQTVMEQDEKTVKHLAAVHQEHLEKARLRHKHAMARVKMGKDKEEMLKQLKTLEREDRTHRQKMLATMPANMFQPVHRRVEMVSEQQRDMEQAFESLLVKQHGVHTHHVLSHMAERTSPAEEQTHHQHSRESTPPHVATRDESLAESPQSDVRPPGWTPPVRPKSPTPSPVKVPTATQQSSSGLSITDVTSSDEVMASLVQQENVTNSSSSGRQPEFGLGVRHVGRGQSGAHELQGETEDRSLASKDMPQLQFPSRGEGMRRLVDMIQSQHQAWNERMAARARQPLRSPPPPQSTPAVPHPEMGTGSFDSSGQPESLSIYTLSSSERETTPSQISTERTTLSTSPPQTSGGGNQVDVRCTVPSTSEAYRREALYSGHPLLASTGHHTGEGTAGHGTDRHVWVTPQHSPMPDTLSISPYSTTLEVSHDEDASAISAPLALQPEYSSHGLLQTQDDPTGQPRQPHSSGAYTYQASQPSFTHSPISDHPVLHTSTVQYPGPFTLHSHQWPYTHHYHTPTSSYSKPGPAVQAAAEGSDSEEEGSGLLSGMQQPIVYRSLETVTSSLSKRSESTLHPPGFPRKLESPEAAHAGYTSKQQQSQQEAVHQHPAQRVVDSMELPLSLSTFQQTEMTATQPEARPSPTPRLYSHPIAAQSPSPSFNQAAAYTEPLSITTLEASQLLSADDDTCSSAGSSLSHTDGVVTTHDPVVTATADPLTGPAPPFTESRLDKELGQVPDTQASLQPLQPLQSPPGEPSVQTPTVNGSTASEASPPVGMEMLLHLSHSTGSGTSTTNPNPFSEIPSSTSSIVPSGEYAGETSSILSRALEEKDAKLPTHSPPTSTLSLQEAFLLKKQDFVRKSQSRIKQLEDGTSQRQLETAKQVGTRHSAPKHKPTTQRQHKYVASTDQGSSGGPHTPLVQSNDKRRAVTFSSPVSHLQYTGMFTPPEIHKARNMRTPVLSSQKRERIRAQEMKERNLRFYNRLPEVRRKHEEDARTKEYATNRERARQYQQKIRTRMSTQKEPRTLINLTRHKKSSVDQST